MVPTVVRDVDKPPYVVDKNKLRRFDSRNTISRRVAWDTSWQGYGRKYNERMLDVIAQGKFGYGVFEFSLFDASMHLFKALKGGKDIHYEPSPEPIRVLWDEVRDRISKDMEDARTFTSYVKKAAKIFGASLVGICKLNRDWIYADVELPSDYEYVVVMAIEMIPELVKLSPSALSAVATGVGFSKMTFLVTTLSKFIQNLGFKAIPSINDIALNIPLAIDSGLGELGRNGLLVTPQYGPRVQLCKVFTNMPLEPDRPIEFGVKEYCKKCKKCARECEAGAISMDDEPSYEIKCKSNNPGALKWYVDVEKCYLFWCENSSICTDCIKVCPYSKV